MRLTRIGIVLLSLYFVLPAAAGFANAAPQMAAALLDGRNYDQTHDTGYIDWSGPVQYVYMTHRDSTSLPPEEGGASCGSGCQEWVTRLGSGGMASGVFGGEVSYFEAMVAFTPDPSVGNATLQACSSSTIYNLRTGSGLPGFVSMILAVPAGCRSWSLSASGGYVDFRSVDVNYLVVPPAATLPPSRTPSMTPALTSTPTAALPSTPTSANMQTGTFTPAFTPTNTSTMTVTPSVDLTLSATPTRTATTTPTFTQTAAIIPSQLPPTTAAAIQQPPRVSIPDRWWIWEAGDLKVIRGNGSLAGLKVTIRDPLDRWRPRVMEYDPDEIPDAIAWDRRFADETLAPSGDYLVLVRACDVHGSCGQDKGIIMIPVGGTRVPTMTLSPAMTNTLVPSVTFVPTHALPTRSPNLPALTSENVSDPVHPSFPLWQILGLLGIFMVISSVSLVDPRPRALKRLGETLLPMSLQAGDDSFKHKQNQIFERK